MKDKRIESFVKFNENSKLSFDEYVDDIVTEINSRFNLNPKEIDEIIDWHRVEIEVGFFGVFGAKGYVNVKTLVNSFVVDGKLKWKR